MTTPQEHLDAAVDAAAVLGQSVQSWREQTQELQGVLKKIARARDRIEKLTDGLTEAYQELEELLETAHELTDSEALDAADAADDALTEHLDELAQVEFEE